MAVAEDGPDRAADPVSHDAYVDFLLVDEASAAALIRERLPQAMVQARRNVCLMHRTWIACLETDRRCPSHGARLRHLALRG
jgi:hypothetical protein